MEKLGNDRIKKVSIVGIKEADQSLYGQLISGKVIASGLDEELAKEATRAGIYFFSFSMSVYFMHAYNLRCCLLWCFIFLPFFF